MISHRDLKEEFFNRLSNITTLEDFVTESNWYRQKCAELGFDANSPLFVRGNYRYQVNSLYNKRKVTKEFNGWFTKAWYWHDSKSIDIFKPINKIGEILRNLWKIDSVQVTVFVFSVMFLPMIGIMLLCHLFPCSG